MHRSIRSADRVCVSLCSMLLEHEPHQGTEEGKEQQDLNLDRPLRQARGRVTRHAHKRADQKRQEGNAEPDHKYGGIA